MAKDLNPKEREMADESMVRTLAAKADAIWPQEQQLFARYQLPPTPSVVDAGCGTGEIHFEPRLLDADDFWNAGPRCFGDAPGTDLRIGRRTYGILRRLGLIDITVDYVVVDPLRVPRATFAAICEAWRDGYADAVSTHTRVTREQFLAHFEDMLATLRDPDGYAVWHVPVVAARVP